MKIEEQNQKFIMDTLKYWKRRALQAESVIRLFKEVYNFKSNKHEQGNKV